MFDFNTFDKRGHTPLHYAVEKQDHDLFVSLINDPYINPNEYDIEVYEKARRSSVIFSAFHKILYNREKYPMRKKFFYDESRPADNIRKLQSSMAN